MERWNVEKVPAVSLLVKSAQSGVDLSSAGERSPEKVTFSLYIEALRQILPWMFVMDHSNYAKWLSVH